MKKILSLTLAMLTVLSLLASCAPAADQLDPAITLASSDAEKYAEWLDGRLDVIPDHVIIGVGSNEKYDVDMSNFDSEGYIARAMNGDVLLFGATDAGLDRAVREYAQAVDVGASSTIDTVYGEGVRIEKLTIAGTDISEFTVVAEREEKRATPVDGHTFDNARVAAEEFVRLTAIATGVTLPIVDKGTESGEHFIRFEFLPVAENGGEQSFTYEVKDGDLIIKGTPRTGGCSNAVNYFFEYELGWDGLTWGDSYLAEADEIDIAEGTAADVDPMFDFFQLYNMYNNPYQNDCSYNYRGKIGRACHGIQNYYGFDDSLVWPETGICYTGESTYDLYYDGFKAVVESRKAGGAKIGEDWLYQDIAHPDGDHYCLCNTCKNLYRKEGNAYSGLTVYFANKVAAQMESEGFGGLKWLIFAYAGSNKPCKTAPREDVWVTLCTDGACVNHPLSGEGCTGDTLIEEQLYYDDEGGVYAITDRTNNSHFADWIRGWSELTASLYVWHYALPTTTYNYTMFDFIYEEWMFLKECGVKGIFWEAEYYGLGLTRLRFELVSWLQWHPDATEEEYNAARDEIMRREYGEGADLVLDMIGLWRESESTVGCFHCWMFTEHFRLGTYDTEIYSKNANQMYELLDIARDKASCYQQDKNIALLQLEVAYRQCMCNYFKAVAEQDTRMLNLLEQRYEQFKSLAAYCGLDIKSFGCALYMGPTSLSDTLEEAAANEWAGYEEELTAESPKDTYDHVVMIGVDGAGAGWSKAGTENISRIFAEGASTQAMRNAIPTVSAPNWGSMLIGVDPQVHGYNNYSTTVYSPTVFQLLRNAHPDAKMGSFVEWAQMNVGYIEDDIGVVKESLSGQELCDRVIDYVTGEKPGFTFVHYNSVDAAGHSYGCESEEYFAALRTVDDYIGQIYDGIVEAGMAEDTLFIVTADHGHTVQGGHGGLTDNERYSFFGAVGNTVMKNDSLDMEARDVAHILTYALNIPGRTDWDSYIPQGLFSDNPTPEMRDPVLSTTDHVNTATPEEGSADHISNYIDMSDVRIGLFFDGNINASVGTGRATKSGEVPFDEGYYGEALQMTPETNVTIPRMEFGTNSFSIACWIKGSEVTSYPACFDGNPVIYSSKSSRAPVASQGINLNFTDWAVNLDLGAGEIGHSYTFGIIDKYEPSEWLHTLVVVDREAGKVKLYLNFALEREFDLHEDLADASFGTGAITFGKDGDSRYVMQDALIDDFIIFNSALEDKDVDAMCGYYFK